MMLRLLNISRPRFWIYEFGTFVLGLLIAGTTISAESLGWMLFFGFYFLVPANLLIYGVNDISDYETDIRNPKKTGYEDVLHPNLHASVFKAIAFTSTPFVLGALFLPLPTLIAFFVFLFFALGYSLPPLRAKARPVFDSIFSAGHYVATGVFGYLLLGGEGGVLWPVVAAMSWAIAMHAYSAVPDIKADSEAGLRTIATLLGGRLTIVVCAFLFTLAAFVAEWYFGVIAFTLALPYVVMMVFSYQADEVRLMRLYTYFPTINAVVGMALFFLVLWDKGWL
jgi:4-hydroxybenzoate polyprenyltransferase